jgi:hypothetical protein
MVSVISASVLAHGTDRDREAQHRGNPVKATVQPATAHIAAQSPARRRACGGDGGGGEADSGSPCLGVCTHCDPIMWWRRPGQPLAHLVVEGVVLGGVGPGSVHALGADGLQLRDAALVALLELPRANAHEIPHTHTRSRLMRSWSRSTEITLYPLCWPHGLINVRGRHTQRPGGPTAALGEQRRLSRDLLVKVVTGVGGRGGAGGRRASTFARRSSSVIPSSVSLR